MGVNAREHKKLYKKIITLKKKGGGQNVPPLPSFTWCSGNLLDSQLYRPENT